MPFSVHFSARTDVGLVRSRNEDSGYAGPHLLAVADGMGGHAGGNVASSLVLARLAPLDGDSHGSDDALQILAETIQEANASLAEAMEADAELTGMGTTLTALMRAGASGLALVHIGDSRGYLLRDGRFTQITKDHSFVQSLVDSGRITETEAEHHPQRSLVTRVLTGSGEDEPDLSIREAKVGDRYLICSDGLSDYVAPDTLSEVVSSRLTPEETTRRLVDLALRSGAPDNVTCVVADLVPPSAHPSSHPIIVGAAADRNPTPAQAEPTTPAAKAAALRRKVTGRAEGEGVQLAEEDESPRRRRIRLVLIPLVAILAVAGACYAAYDWSQRQLYIGESGGHVAVYQGIPQQLGPWQLSSLKTRTDIPVDGLPSFPGQRVRENFTVANQADADTNVAELHRAWQTCLAERQAGQVECTGNASTPTATPAPSAPATTPNPAGSPIGPAAGPAQTPTAGFTRWPLPAPPAGGTHDRVDGSGPDTTLVGQALGQQP